MYLESFIEIYKSGGFKFDEAKAEIDFVLDVLFCYTYKDFLLNKSLLKWQIREAEKVFKERVTTFRPIQQLTGCTFFYGRKFLVNEYTLIPRPETELLVQKVLEIKKNFDSVKVLDIGTGSGCIGLTLMLENSKIESDMTDIQCGALEVARKNAEIYNIKENAEFIESDLFDNIKKRYDIIVSNPPYIPLKEKETLQIEVREYESPIALFTKDDYGLEYYERIIKSAGNYLKNDGAIAFEIGINQAERVKQLLEKNGFNKIDIMKDYNGVERVISAKVC